MVITKILKIVGIILAVIILLVAVCLYLLAHFVNPNKFKSMIIDTVNEKIGRHLTINGDLSWSFFPWIGFQINGVELSNAPGFGNTPFARVKHLDISVAVLPLLSGNLEVKNVEADGLWLNLARNQAGAFNWDDLAKITAPAKTTKKTTTAGSNTVETTTTPNNSADNTVNFSIANLTIVHGELAWNDAQQNQQYNLTNLYINGSNVGTEQVFPLTISFNATSTNFSKPLAISLNANFNIDDELDSFAINSAEIKVNEFAIEGDFSASKQDDQLTYQGDLQLLPFNLNNLMTLFKIESPKMASETALNKIGSDLAFNGDQNSMTINPINITVDSTNINGNLTVNDFSKPQVNFKLTANQFNLDNYLKPVTSDHKNSNNAAKKAAPQNSSDALYSTEKINLPTELLQKLNVTGSLSLNELIAKNLHLNNVSATFTANNGILKLSPVKLNLYEGNATVNAMINVNSATPRYSFNMAVNNVQGGALLVDFTDKDFIAGTANFVVDMNTDGDNVKALVNHLNGNSNVAFAQGQLKGVNLGYQLARVQALIAKKNPPAEPSNKNTSFGKITASIIMTNGLAKNNDLMMANDLFTGAGKGSANLNNQQLDYAITITPKQGDDLRGYQIPLNIKGAFASPIIGMDFESLIKQLLRNQVKQQIKNTLQQQAGKLSDNKAVQDALGSLFGK